MTVPYSFGTATSAIPLSQLDSNFNTPITLGNTAIQLGNTVTTLNNMTLANVTVSSGTITLTDITASGNVTLSGGTANGVAYLNGSKVVTTGSALTFDGTNFGVANGYGLFSGNPSIPALSSTQAAIVHNTGYGAVLYGNGTTYDVALLNAGTSVLYGVSNGGAHTWFAGGSRAMDLTSTGLGIGTNSPATRLSVDNTRSDTAGTGWFTYTNAAVTSGKRGMRVDTSNGFWFDYYNGSTWSGQMVLDASGNLILGTTSAVNNGKFSILWNGTSVNAIELQESSGASGAGFVLFRNSSGTAIGSITRVTTTNAVVYNTTSDYRLKDVISAVSGHGERIDALEPIDYKWKEDGSNARGFLAHKFKEIYPNSVTGEKDAVDETGNPVYQSMQASTSEVIADLVAELQSLRKRVAELEGAKA